MVRGHNRSSDTEYMAATDQRPENHKPLATQEPSIHGPRPMPDAGIIVDIEVVTGEEADFARMAERLEALEVTLGRHPGTVTADKAYGIGKVYKLLSDREIQAFGHPSNQWRRGLTPTASDHATRQRQGLSHPALAAMMPRMMWLVARADGS